MDFKNLLFIFLLIGLVSNVSALEFDNKLTYEDGDLKAKFSNSFLGVTTTEIGTAKLMSHKSVTEIKRVGLGKQITMWYDFDFKDLYKEGLGEVEFIDEKTGAIVERNYTFVYWGEKIINIYGSVECENDYNENGTRKTCNGIIDTEVIYDWMPLEERDIKKGKVRIGLLVDVKEGDLIDGRWNIVGIKVDKHSAWAANLDTGLIAYFKLDEASGTSSGVDVNQAGKINTAYDWESGDGSDEINLGVNANFDLYDDFSINLWTKPESTGANAKGRMFNRNWYIA